jgi:hypothetical protein
MACLLLKGVFYFGIDPKIHVNFVGHGFLKPIFGLVFIKSQLHTFIVGMTKVSVIYPSRFQVLYCGQVSEYYENEWGERGESKLLPFPPKKNPHE